ncbi:MAG: hypothetical protein QG664_926 [Patescibacteria group bacterium]|nr:hypothetical protein [Patescibacteria group bacterium]
MEDFSFWLIALCGFLAGSSANLNSHGVIQRGPNLFWLGPAIAVGAATLIWGDVVDVSTFLVANTLGFFLGILLGGLAALVFRAETPAISD